MSWALAEARDFLFSKTCRPAVGLTQTHWVRGSLPGVNAAEAWRLSHHHLVQRLWMREGVCMSTHHVPSWTLQGLLYPSWRLRSIKQCWNINLWHIAFNISRWNAHSIAALRLHSNCHHGSTVIFCCYLLLCVEQLQLLSPTETSGSPSNVSARSLASVQRLALAQEMNRTMCVCVCVCVYIYIYIFPWRNSP